MGVNRDVGLDAGFGLTTHVDFIGRLKWCALLTLMRYMGLVGGLWVLGQSLVHAHVKWFSPVGTELQNYSLLDPEVWLASFLVATGLVIAWFLNRWSVQRFQDIEFPLATSQWPFILSRYLLAIALLGSAHHGNILAPHIQPEHPLMSVFLLLEAATALLIISGSPVALRVSGIFLLALVACGALYQSLFVLEYALFIGFAYYFFYATPAQNKRALLGLRVAIGVALISLAFTEKLLNPHLALDVISQYPFNFMQLLGLDYSDRLFVLSAGFAELLFGLVFITGLVTRLNTLVLAIFLVMTNAYFFFAGFYQEGIMELLGHLPIFAAAALFLGYANGLAHSQLNARTQASVKMA